MGHWARYCYVATPFIPFEFTRLLRAVSALSARFIILHPKSKNIFLAQQDKKDPLAGAFLGALKIYSLYSNPRAFKASHTWRPTALAGWQYLYTMCGWCMV